MLPSINMASNFVNVFPFYSGLLFKVNYWLYKITKTGSLPVIHSVHLGFMKNRIRDGGPEVCFP